MLKNNLKTSVVAGNVRLGSQDVLGLNSASFVHWLRTVSQVYRASQLQFPYPQSGSCQRSPRPPSDLMTHMKDPQNSEKLLHSRLWCITGRRCRFKSAKERGPFARGLEEARAGVSRPLAVDPYGQHLNLPAGRCDDRCKLSQPKLSQLLVSGVFLGDHSLDA